MPSIGETMMNAAVLMMPGASSGAMPAFETAAPIMPPMSACDELDGIPKYQVMRFQDIAPMSAPKISAVVDERRVDDALAHGRGDGQVEDTPRRAR